MGIAGCAGGSTYYTGDTGGRAENGALQCLSVGFLRDWILERISQLDPAAWRGVEGSWGTLQETVMGELRHTRHHG